MAIKRQIVAACCGGGSSIIFYLDVPLLKQHVSIFKDAGYTIPQHYINSGIFYARKDSLTASGTLGTTKITVKCGISNREQKLNEFQQLLEQAEGILIK